MVTPNTSIILLKCPLTLSNKNQMTFASKTAQYNYFYSLPKLEDDDTMYQRKDGVIRFPAHADSLQEYNYCMYQNENYGNKWFYAFITKIEYANDNCSFVSIKTDVFQTWQFDLIWKESFVEREHVLDDTIGLHTVPENLDVGEVIEEDFQEDSSYTNEYGFYIAVATDWQPDDNSLLTVIPSGKQFNGITVYNNQIFGDKILLFKVASGSNQGFIDLGLYLLRTNDDGHIADVKDIFIVPNAIIDDSQLTQHMAYCSDNNTNPFYFYTMPFSKTMETFNTTISKLTSFTNFTPKNNKCFCYPYNFLYVTNNNGNNNIFKYEDFSTANCIFENQLAMSIGLSGRLVPKDYQGKPYCDDESLPLGKYPTCGWSADSYTNWLTQNAINIPTKLIFSTIPAVGLNTDKGLPSLKANIDPVSTGLNIGQTIASTIGDFISASLMPNIEGGGNNGNIIFAANKMCFTFRKMRSKTEYLEQIDNYFTLYGYKTNLLKIPNLTNRPNWNYVKTIGANILGNLPQLDLVEIKQMFDNGITLWHNTSTFLDYSQNNI